MSAKPNVPFWLVWCPQGRSPTYKHPSAAGARMEAERLARMNRGQSFYVLEPKAEVKAVDVQVTEFGDPTDDIPF